MTKTSQVDFLVMGAGVAGLRAAIELAHHGEVLVVTKESLGESNNHYAQGGIAVATEGETDVALHLEDTVKAGDGLVYRPAAEALVREGPLRVSELIEWGAAFDTEAGHASGVEISRTLVALARGRERIHFAERTMVTKLVAENGRVVGADLSAAGLLASDQVPRRVNSRAVLIASGGAGQVFSDTTNPSAATGDGVALAAQAGADLADMEFYQFHPTALSLPGVPRFPLSEALRGEGAYLRNDQGERFMERYDPLLELAPRDVVARAIAREGKGTKPGETRPVYLDMRHVTEIDLNKLFPGITAFLAQHGLDLARDLFPVCAAAHYLMGGIKTEVLGRTSLKGLYAAGEAACTGVHGANRLASNSLLEGLVFGTRAAQSMIEDDLPLVPIAVEGPETPAAPLTAEEDATLEKLIAELQNAMWSYAGLLRGNFFLLEGFAAQSEFADGLKKLVRTGRSSRRLCEALAMSRVSNAILHSALARTESRGAHFRNDYPKRDDQNFQKHSVFASNGKVRFEAW